MSEEKLNRATTDDLELRPVLRKYELFQRFHEKKNWGKRICVKKRKILSKLLDKLKHCTVKIV